MRGRIARRGVLAVVVILILALAAPAVAKPPDTKKTAKVTGTYTYLVYDVPRTVSLGVHATDPVKGTWTWFHPSGTYSGPASCVRIDGDDAWVAGPSWDGTFAVFIYVHDGGTPGRAGDTAFTWGADPWETLEDMEALCETMQQPPFYGLMPFDVISGNANVWDSG